MRTKFILESTDVEPYTRSGFDSEEKTAHAHPCDILIVGHAEATDQLLLLCRHLGYSPHCVSTYDLSAKAYRRRHYDLIFILLDDSGAALKFLRKIRMDEHIQQPRYVVGLALQAPASQIGAAKASGLNELLTMEPGAEHVRSAILKAVDSNG